MTIIDDRWRPSFDEIARSNYRAVGTVLTPLFQFTRFSWVSMNAPRIDTGNGNVCDRETGRNSTNGPSNSRRAQRSGGICYVCIYARTPERWRLGEPPTFHTISAETRRCYARNLAGTLPAHRNVNTINLGAASNFKQRIAIVRSVLGLAHARWTLARSGSNESIRSTYIFPSIVTTQGTADGA